MFNEIIGIRFVNYTSKKTGQPVLGRYIYFTYEDRNVSGKACDSIFISDRNFGDLVLTVGQEIRVLYNKFGQVDFIETK